MPSFNRALDWTSTSPRSNSLLHSHKYTVFQSKILPRTLHYHQTLPVHPSDLIFHLLSNILLRLKFPCWSIPWSRFNFRAFTIHLPETTLPLLPPSIRHGLAHKSPFAPAAHLVVGSPNPMSVQSKSTFLCCLYVPYLFPLQYKLWNHIFDLISSHICLQDFKVVPKIREKLQKQLREWMQRIQCFKM
jgi:hypothetical protein